MVEVTKERVGQKCKNFSFFNSNTLSRHIILTCYHYEIEPEASYNTTGFTQLRRLITEELPPILTLFCVAKTRQFPPNPTFYQAQKSLKTCRDSLDRPSISQHLGDPEKDIWHILFRRLQIWCSPKDLVAANSRNHPPSFCRLFSWFGLFSM